MDQQQHEDRFIKDNSIITSGAQDIRNNGNNKKVSRYGQSISRFRGGPRGGPPSATSGRNVGESRDDGDQQHSWQLEEQNQNSIIINPAGSFIETNSSDTNTSARKDFSSQVTRRGHSNGSSSSLAPVQLESLLQQRQQLTARLQELETQFDSIQKHKAYEKGVFAMQRGQLMVEIEGLREDHVFLTKKRDKLGRKLLAIHLKRVERMESEELKNEEREARQIQRSGSQTSF